MPNQNSSRRRLHWSSTAAHAALLPFADPRIDGALVVTGTKTKQCLASGTWDTTAADVSECTAIDGSALEQYGLTKMEPKDAESAAALTAAANALRRTRTRRQEEAELNCDSSFVDIVAACPEGVDQTIIIRDECLAAKIISVVGTWINVQKDATAVLDCDAVQDGLVCANRNE